MSQALYRKYRSKKLSEIVGQEHITRTLDRAIKAGKISHAYLFTGPRGVGKTSIARILAHEVNSLDYTDESIHLDIIEIDAASNRRIDEIRDLRDKVHIAPTTAKYKVYIIDEVHMLTKEAFNALLKTLEEPPAHVIFILATTEAHKLPETIVSRTQRFTFKAIEKTAAVEHLRTIAKQEGITIEDDALSLLAEHGNGSFRDSISLLDQVGNSKKKITKQDAESLIGLAASEHIAQLLDATLAGTPADIVTRLDQLTEDGIGPSQAAKQLARELRSRIIEGSHYKGLIELLGRIIEVPASQVPLANLELALFDYNVSYVSETSSPLVSAKPPVTPQLKELPIKKSVKATKTNPETKPKEAPKAEIQEAEEKPASTPTEETVLPSELTNLDWWPKALEQVKQVNNTLYGVLRMAETELDGSVLNLKFKFAFHQKKIADTTTQAKVTDAIEKATGQRLSINPVHDAAIKEIVAQEIAAPLPHIEAPAAKNDTLSSITNIFGGGEVLES